MIAIKRLLSRDLIEEACEILYKVHIVDGKWDFSADNPSEIRVEIKNGREIFTDRFTEQAIWFGAFDGEKLIGCTRLCHVDENGKLEIEGYSSSQVIQEFLPKDKTFCVESTRTAVSEDYTGQGVVRKLLLAAFKYCEENKLSIAACVSNIYLKELLQKIGYPLKLEHAFKYEPQDPSPVNFYFADYNKSEVKHMVDALESIKGKLGTNNNQIFKYLDIVAPILPTPVYWHDTEGVVLGLNEHCLKGMGASRDVVGKTPYDFYSKEIAEHILTHNEQVIRSAEILSQDERIEDITTGQVKYFRNIKSPLYNDEGKIIGIIGTAIDITAEKDAERLRLENEAHKAVVEEQNRFRKIVDQVAHDIRSPVASLEMFTKICTRLPEDDRISLREIATSITDIANNLLSQYKNSTYDNQTKVEAQQPVLVYTLISQLMTDKKYQYRERNINFKLDTEANSYFTFINMQPTAFKRMLSNLINNSADAFDGKPGLITLSMETKDNLVTIKVQDNGKGMPESVREKILNNISITDGKQDGHGIGLTQVRETLQNNAGTLDIISEIGVGTTINLTFAKIPLPSWSIDNLSLRKDDIIVVLDDDSSIHTSWDLRFEQLLKEFNQLQVKHFTLGQEALDYINSLKEKEKNRVFLLTDFELLEQGIDGLDVIAETGVRRSILVTSHYSSRLVRKNAKETNTRILPKQLAYQIPINIDNDENKNESQDNVEIVVVDDNQMFLDVFVRYMLADRRVDSYDDPSKFLDNLDKYDKNTRIILDNQFDGYNLTGVELAEKLYSLGYTKLYLLSGKNFREGECPAFLTLILKDDLDQMQRIFGG